MIDQSVVVLVVDDDPIITEVIGGLLQNISVTVRTANSSLAALRMAKLEPLPALILLDILMPEMDGYQVLAELRKIPETSGIPVIFVTALDAEIDEERGLSLGAVDYLTKPVKPGVLLARVLSQLELRSLREDRARRNDWLEAEVQRRTNEIKQINERLQFALETSCIGIWEHDYSDGLCRWSDSLCALAGYDVGPGTIHESMLLIHPEDAPVYEQEMRKAMAAAEPFFLPNFRMRHQAGHWVWMESRGRVIARNEAGEALLCIGTLTDVTQRKVDEAKLRLTSTVFSCVGDGICVTGADRLIIFTNAAFSRMTGYSQAEVLGQNPRILKSGVQPAAFYQAMWEQIDRYGNWQGEMINRRKDGSLVTEWLSISAVSDAVGKVNSYVGISSDLSERKEISERIKHLSNYDSLTELPNRNLFSDHLDQAISTARRFERSAALILLDLDRFRLINDTLGPPVGDDILVEVSRRLLLQVRDGDTVGRRSGNEFGFVMANLGRESDAIALAQRMLEAISVPFELAGQSLVITASIGISIFSKDGETSEELFKAADGALLRAKNAGRNTFRFYSPQMDADAARRLGIENALRDALRKNELQVFYQPQVSLDSGQLIGMEALLRVCFSNERCSTNIFP